MKSNRKSQRVKHFLGLIDSGSNCDIVTEEFFLDEAEVQATPISGVAGKAKSKLKGKVRAWVRGEKLGHGTKQKIVFDSVNHLGEAHCSIFTVSKLTRKGSIVHFEDGNNYILLPDGTRVNMVEKNGLYYIRLEHIASPEEINCMVAMKKPEYRPEILGNGTALAADINLWHNRLHISPKRIKAIYDLGAVEGSEINNLPALFNQSIRYF